MDTIVVYVACQQDMLAWDEFVFAHDEATFFHRAGWFDVLNHMGLRPYYLIARQGTSVCGILPLAHSKSILFGNHLVSLPFCVYAGLVVESEAVIDPLLTKAREIAISLNVDDLELRNRQPLNGDYLTKSLYFTFRKKINESAEDNLAAIPRKQRAMVRKGIQAGLTAEITHDLTTFYPTYAESVRNLGTPVFAKSYFQCLLDTFAQDTDILLVKNPHGKTIAGVLSFYFKDEVLPYYGGSLIAARQLKGNDFMYWELMRHAIARGASLFDFGRSKADTGPFKFKKNWGFEPQPLSYQYIFSKTAQIPNVSPTNPKYHLLVESWKRLPLPVANLLGPLLSRHLG